MSTGRATRGEATSALFWVTLYTALVLAPLLVVATGVGTARGSGWWFDFSMGLGFGALAVMGGQFALTARFRRATAPFGVDVIYVFHRWLAVVGLTLVVGHYAVLRMRYADTLLPWTPLDAPIYMTAGRMSVGLFLVVIATSLWRKRMGIEYDRWRIVHGVLAVLAMILAVVHVRGVAYYSANFFSRTVLDAFMFSLVAIFVYVRLVKPLLLASRPHRVESVRPERGGAWVITLRPSGSAGISFQPGQFAWLSLGVAPWRAREHPFSFSGSSEAEGSLEFTIKELGDFTNQVGRTEVGSVAYVDGPHGSFSIDRRPDAPGYFFLAGGVGIAPILSMLRSLADRGDGRPHRLVYGNPRWDRVMHREEIARLEEQLDLRVTHVLRDPPEGWQGESGVPDRDVLRRALVGAPDGIHCFLCGPEPMTDLAQRVLRDAGIGLHRIHYELFDMV